MPCALLTGITGQDGSYLAELLLSKGYQVHGIVRPTSPESPARLAHLCANPTVMGKQLFLHRAELEDVAMLRSILEAARPAEIYHLAGQSHVGMSFECPELTCQTIAFGTIRWLELARHLNPSPRLFHASSGQIFGEPKQVPQDEETAIAPVNPYGCAKAFATQMVSTYRRSYGLFVCNGILFNHESPRRGENFVTSKICRGAAAICLGLQSELILGDLKAERDWGHARDYVEGMWRMLQHTVPEDFVLATGRLHSVQEMVELAFATVNLNWSEFVRQDAALARPADPSQLVGNPAKAKRLLHWEPQVAFKDLIAEMTQAELARLSKGS